MSLKCILVVFAIPLSLFVLFVAEPAEATCSPRSDEMYYAIDCDPTQVTPTKGIQEAIDACGSGYTTKGCAVIMPRGDVVITDTITLGGLTNATAKEGVALRGHGSGIVTSVDVADGGTNLIWDGTSAPVLSLQGVRAVRVEDVTIWGDSDNDGANVASKLIEVLADTTPVSSVIIENVVLSGTKAEVSKPIGIDLIGQGSQPHDQLDLVVVRNSRISHVHTCLHQASNQALLNLFRQVNCTLYTDYGVDVEGGSTSIVESFFGPAKDSGAIASIRYEGSAAVSPSLVPLYQNVERSHFEVKAGKAIISDGPGWQNYHTRIEGNNFVLQQADPSPNDPADDVALIDMRMRGEVLIEGNSFSWTGAFTGVGADIIVSSTNPSQLTAIANHNRNLVNLDWVTGQSTTLNCQSSDALGPFADFDCDGVRVSGEPYFSGLSNSERHGAARWGNSDAATAAEFDTGNEVCAEDGLMCVEVMSLANPAKPTLETCSTVLADGVRFFAMCK